MQVCGILRTTGGEDLEIRAGDRSVEIMLPGKPGEVLSFESQIARKLAKVLISAADQADASIGPSRISGETKLN